MSTTESIYGLAQACALIQAMPDKIRQAAKALDVEPVMRIDGRDYYRESDLEQIRDHLQKGEK